MSTKETLVCWH